MLQFRLVAIVCLLFSFSGAVVAEIPEQLQQRQEQLFAAFARVRGTVVGVSDGFGVGSGVVVQPDGLVLTASHVVDSGHRHHPDRQITITFPDGAEYPAKVLGKNRDADATMLKITAEPRNGSEFPYAEMGKTTENRPGQWCFALGNPGGFRPDRPAALRIGRLLSVGHRTVVSDCSIVLGDSGGPLFDMDGRVIGIHSMITPLIIENRHVAIDCWHRDWKRFLNNEVWGELRARDNHLAISSFFGVGLKWKDFSAEVSHVMAESPADAAGLIPGDVLVSVNSERFADRLDLGTLLSQIPDETTVDVVVMRGGQETRLKLQTGVQEEAIEEQESRLGRIEHGGLEDDRDDEMAEQLSSGRRIGPLEKRAADQIRLFEPVVAATKQSVVAIRDGGPVICLGTVMSRDGYILTKASEIANAIEPECVLTDGRRFVAREVAVDYFYDLALIHVPVTDLKPVDWLTDESPEVGTLTIIQDSRGNALIPAVVSVKTRTMPNSTKGFLGVQLDRKRDLNGVRIISTIRSGAAARGGLRKDDIVLSIDGASVATADQMIDRVSRKKPGDTLSVRFMREDTIRTLEIVLTPRFDNLDDAMMELYKNSNENDLQGQFASLNSGGYPEALQHDADVFPNQVGGPLLGLNGRAIGLNIARNDRVVSYAIPADSVLRVYRALLLKDNKRSADQP